MAFRCLHHRGCTSLPVPRAFAMVALGCLFLAGVAPPWNGGTIAAAAELVVDFSQTNGVIRRIHGGNNGPLCSGEIVDLTAYHRQLALPMVRLHDSAWPYPDIVDVHALFPNFAADPESADSYRFAPTDDYLTAITNAGSRIVFRLGESIEHAKRKRYVHPPADVRNWAHICVGIIRHYNEGWAGGHRMGIEYWEIWNEPENRPAMWTGTAAEYYSLYSTTAKLIKEQWPRLKVGGPSLGHQGEFTGGKLKPSEFLRGFMDHVHRQRAPLDFFSWHAYDDQPGALVERARAIRTFLDLEGFARTESHLNEWNYLPDHNWGPMIASAGEARERWYSRQGGMEGAAFAAAVLMSLQDAPLEMANYYSADNQPFGLFTLHGSPKKTFHAFRAFRSMLETPIRVRTVEKAKGGAFWLAGINSNRTAAAVMVALPRGSEGVREIEISGLPWSPATSIGVRVLDASRDLLPLPMERRTGASFVIPLKLTNESVALLRFEKAAD